MCIGVTAVVREARWVRRWIRFLVQTGFSLQLYVFEGLCRRRAVVFFRLLHSDWRTPQPLANNTRDQT